MNPRTYKSEGIVLARRSYGEADRILVLYTKHYGRLSLMAKGVRKPKSRKRGHIEVFSHIEFQAARGQSLDILTEVEVIDSFNSIRTDLKKVSVAYFLLETIGRITREEEKNEELFNLLLDSLKKLQKTSKLRSLREKFVKDALVIAGFWPKNMAMDNPDKVLEDVAEREIASIRVGKKLVS